LRRVRINDGSHPDGWVEFEVDGLRQSEREVRELRGGLADVSGAMQRQSAIVLEYAKQMALHLDVMRGIGANSKSQTDATEKLTKAVDEWCRLLAEKNKDDPAASQNSPAAKSADDRRRYM
jgi:hypothetical protein